MRLQPRERAARLWLRDVSSADFPGHVSVAVRFPEGRFFELVSRFGPVDLRALE